MRYFQKTQTAGHNLIIVMLSCLVMATSCKTDKPEPEPEDPATDISARFIDPVLRQYVSDVIEAAYYNGDISDNKTSIRNAGGIITLNLANNYIGAPKVSSLLGIDYLTALKIVDMRGQDVLRGTYDLRALSGLYYIRIEGAPNVKFIVTSQQKRLILGQVSGDQVYGVFDGDSTQLLTK